MKKFLIFLILILSCVSEVDAQYNKRKFYYDAQIAMQQRNYRKAVYLMTILVEHDSRDFEALFHRAVAKYNLNDFVGAERDLSSAILQNPNYAQAYQYRAIVKAMSGDYDNALKDFQESIDRRPDFTQVFYSRGITYFLNQQFEKAIADLTHCIGLFPKMKEAYVNRGAAYLMSQDTIAALKDYDKVLELDYRNSEIYVRKGVIYSEQKKYDLAFEEYNDAIKFDDTYIPAYFNRAMAHAGTFAYDKAVADFTKVLEIDPNNSLTYFNRALLLSQIGDYNNALKDYDKVVELTPNNVLGVYNRAMLNAKLGNLINSLEDYTRAIDLYPDFANAYMNRSNIKYMLNDMKGSQEDNEIAKQKISDYRSNMEKREFDAMVDTSKVMNRLLSFDMDFGNKEFDGVRGKRFDIRQLPQYRLTFDADPARIPLNRRYNVSSLSKMIVDYGNNLTFANKKLTVKENKLLNDYSLQLNRILFNRDEYWKTNIFDAIIQSSQKQFSNAMNHLDNAVYFNPYNAYLYASRAAARSEMVEYASKIDIKTQKFVIGVDDTFALKGADIKYSYKDALDDINMAIRLAPDVAYLYYNRGVIKCLNGDMPGAISDYTEALSLYPNFAEALYNRGMIQLYIKESQKGFMDMTRASELGLDDAFVVLENFGSLFLKDK